MRRRQLLANAAAISLARFPVASAATASVARQVKITGLETDLLRLPPGRVYYDAIHRFGGETGSVVLRLKTDAGITGWAYSSFGTTEGGPRAVQTILEQELKPVLIGQDPAFSKRLRAEMWKATEYHGVQGLSTFALAAVDLALWDIMGKLLGAPVYRLLGACRDRVPTYDMCGWYYDNDEDLSQYKRAITAALDEGFHAVKIKVGRSSLDDDVRRIKAAQELCGKSRRVMVDANQVFNTNEAIRRGRVYQELGCFWLEEPLPPHDMDGMAELAHALDMRIATGENLYTKYAFLDLLKRGGADVVQPDNRRAGGVTEWMELAAIADAFGVELASHGGGATNMHMLLAIPNAIYMESGSLKNDSTHLEKLRMVDGEVLAPEMPGIGSELRQDFIDKHKV
jgi:L-alanine-DL-glutamate epimerase-like enolase superfamily enzyme